MERTGTVLTISLANTLTFEGVFNLNAGYLTVEKIARDEWMVVHHNYPDSIKGFYKLRDRLTDSEVADLLADELEMKQILGGN